MQHDNLLIYCVVLLLVESLVVLIMAIKYMYIHNTYYVYTCIRVYTLIVSLVKRLSL